MPPLVPPTLTSTRGPSTTGDEATPKYPFGASNTFLVSTLHSILPVLKSMPCSMPSAPCVKTRPPAITGTARGPSSNPKSSR
jgi:hypothetical protein